MSGIPLQIRGGTNHHWYSTSSVLVHYCVSQSGHILHMATRIFSERWIDRRVFLFRQRVDDCLEARVEVRIRYELCFSSPYF